MARKPEKKTQKSQIVAFKVEEELAKFLDKLPNKSDFIRKAILAQFAMNCPLCRGTGVVERGVHDHFDPIIASNRTRPCEKCKTPVSFPMTAEGMPPTDEKRFEQFLHGGPLYCAKCYPNIPPCDGCGWHVMLDKFAEHFKTIHKAH